MRPGSRRNLSKKRHGNERMRRSSLVENTAPTGEISTKDVQSVRLSEAIRRGSKLRPKRCTKHYIRGKRSVCALGAAGLKVRSSWLPSDRGWSVSRHVHVRRVAVTRIYEMERTLRDRESTDSAEIQYGGDMRIELNEQATAVLGKLSPIEMGMWLKTGRLGKHLRAVCRRELRFRAEQRGVAFFCVVNPGGIPVEFGTVTRRAS